jgi:hypothetical protein
MTEPRHTCARCGAPEGVDVFRRRRDGAWFDRERRAWCTPERGVHAVDPRFVQDNPEWLESIGRARKLRTRLQLDGVCFVCAQQIARTKMDGAA